MKASDILNISDIRTKEVDVPRWGKMSIRELGLSDTMELSRMYQRVVDGDTVTLSGEDIAWVISRGVVDENGERVFSDKDVPKLAQKHREPMLFLYHEISALAGGVEEAEKN